jgi:hypothetical protein
MEVLELFGNWNLLVKEAKKEPKAKRPLCRNSQAQEEVRV